MTRARTLPGRARARARIGALAPTRRTDGLADAGEAVLSVCAAACVRACVRACLCEMSRKTADFDDAGAACVCARARARACVRACVGVRACACVCVCLRLSERERA